MMIRDNSNASSQGDEFDEDDFEPKSVKITYPEASCGLEGLSPYGPRTTVDETDVSGWGAYNGHAIPMKFCRAIAERINAIHPAPKPSLPKPAVTEEVDMSDLTGVNHEIVVNFGHISKERADWLVDAVAGSTQNRAFLRGDSNEDSVATESIFLNGEKAILVAIHLAMAGMICPNASIPKPTLTEDKADE